MNSKQLIICLSSSSRISFPLFSLVTIFLTFTTISASYGVNETDHMALLSFKSMINDPYGALSSWNNSVHFCNWFGVSCGKRHRRVIVLRLDSQGIEGSLSPHVGNLSFLRKLGLWNNSIEGSIPHELGRLSRLRILFLDQNKFDGVIPTDLSGCSNLKKLSFSQNKLVGSIPKGISFLSKLTLLVIYDNQLTGGIPPFLGNITSFEGLDISDNQLGGSIPDTLGRLKSLREVICNGCNLNGTIPLSIYNLSLLTTLSLYDNQLTGNLPLEIGAVLPNLLKLLLWNNQLSGDVPPSISNCSKLINLELYNNTFSAKLKLDFANLRDIQYIMLSYNNLHGAAEDDDIKFIDSLINCSRLETLDLSYCSLQGVLPVSIGNFSDQLRRLNLEYNQLYGNIPSSIGSLVGLDTLFLDFNEFKGQIPTAIGKLQKLQVLDLSANQFSGSIPHVLGNLSLLSSLYLYSNRLEGNIPSNLGNCHNLLELHLFDNKLGGKIPKQLLQLPSLSKVLDLSQNQLCGSIPNEVGNLKMLTFMDFSNNNLTGDIPSSLGGCISLSYLSLENNFFTGMIPPSISSLKGLEILDISQNNLSGQIPRFLEQFRSQFFNLSFNEFEGEVPVKGLFANTSAFSILGNSRLCGGLGELGLSKCKETNKRKKRFPLLIVIVISVASAVFAIILCVCVLCKKKRNGQLTQSSRNKRFPNVSYNQLLKATNGFSEANLIGKGGYSSVYKGILDVFDHKFVAVKVLHLQIRGAQRSFIRECEAWRNIRHRNLLKIITSCSSVDFQGNDFKAIIYEYMPNGSLHNWLHSSVHTSRPNIIQRINILMDVAFALDYLHNHCETTIVHGDLKPRNILLDDDMVAHVGDFGLARFLGTDSDQNSSIGFKGTIGYAPPECGLGRERTSTGDVYSYGILLLEIMTGKCPTDNIFIEGLNLHQFAYMALSDNVIDVIDSDAIVLQSTEANAKKMEECLAATVKIGVSCSVDSPSLRMGIENVVYELQHIINVLQSIEV